MRTKKVMGYILGLVFIITAFIPYIGACRVKASSGAGGYNEYLSRKYNSSAEDVAKLEQILQEDGYVECTPENDWLGLKVASFQYEGLLTEYNFRDYHIWVSKRDLESYKNSTEKTKYTEMNALQNNAVICAYYEFNLANRDSDNPSGLTNNDIPADWKTGTLVVNVENGTDSQTDVSLLLQRAEDLEYYPIKISVFNDYTSTTILPIGNYYVYSAFLNDKYVAQYDPSFGVGKDGFQIREGEALAFTIGFGVDELPPASWQDTTETYKVPKVTASPNQPTDRYYDRGEETSIIDAPKEDNKTTAIIIVCIIGGVLLIGVIIVVVWLKKNKDDTF